MYNIFDHARVKECHHVPIASAAITALDYARDGNSVVVGSADGLIQIVDVSYGKVVCFMSEHKKVSQVQLFA